MDKRLIITYECVHEEPQLLCIRNKAENSSCFICSITVCGGKLYKIEYTMRKRRENKMQGVFFFNNNLSF